MRNEIDSEESIEDINCKNIFLNFLAQKSNDKNSQSKLSVVNRNIIHYDTNL